MSRINVANFRHPDGTSDNINLDSSGRVGIGTTSPGANLHVKGNDIIQYVEATGTAAEICFRNNTSTGDNIRIGGSGNNLTFDTGGAESMRIDSSGNFKFNSGYGSVATAYGVRAWVNFNGKNTVSIRNSGNVSSITDQGSGLYRINFTTAMVDANYSAVGSSGEDDNNTTPNNHGFRLQRNSPLTGSVGIATTNEAGTPTDHTYICCTVVR